MQRYSINIARKERRGTQMLMTHWARVEAGIDTAHAFAVREELRKHFPSPQWAVDMTKWDERGETCK